MIDHHTSLCCPFCGNLHDLRRQAEELPDGAIMMCHSCGEFCELEDGKLVIPADETYDFINDNEALQGMKAAWINARGMMQ